MPAHFWKLLSTLVGWKFAHLISQLMTGIQQKLFRLKTCPQGLLQAQEEKSGFRIFTTSYFACFCKNWPLKSKNDNQISKTVARIWSNENVMHFWYCVIGRYFLTWHSAVFWKGNGLHLNSSLLLNIWVECWNCCQFTSNLWCLHCAWMI